MKNNSTNEIIVSLQNGSECASKENRKLNETKIERKGKKATHR